MRLFRPTARDPAHKTAVSRLDALVAEFRAAAEPQDRLSDASRDRLVRAIRRSGRDAAPQRVLSDLFLPTQRWTTLAAVPALLLALLLGPFALAPRVEVRPEVAGEATLMVGKIDGVAVLVIANGGRPHRIYKSSDVQRMTSGQVLTATGGAYRDRLEGGPSLVFYQVD